LPFLITLGTFTSLGRPAYFDTSATQPSPAATQAGVTSAASEEAKDIHHLETVSNDGLCESFGVGSPFTLSTFFTIADHTTVKNGLSPKLAGRQLLQWLSMTLMVKWSSDAILFVRRTI